MEVCALSFFNDNNKEKVDSSLIGKSIFGSSSYMNHIRHLVRDEYYVLFLYFIGWVTMKKRQIKR